MKTGTKSLCFVLLLFFTIPVADAQHTIQVERPFASRALAGHIYVGTKDFNSPPIDSITVELCTPNWQSVLVSTKTDKNAYFALEKPKNGSLFYLRFRANGLNLYQIRVRIKRFSPKELTIYMVNAA